MHIQRKPQERRCFLRTASFPLIDADERMVLIDRRNIPCRRTSNIAVEWVCVYDFHEMSVDGH